MNQTVKRVLKIAGLALGAAALTGAAYGGVQMCIRDRLPRPRRT